MKPKKKLLFKQIIKCPDRHETVSKVYEIGEYLYYQCGICEMIVGLDSPKHEDQISKIILIGLKEYPRSTIKGGFTGPNIDEIEKLLHLEHFVKREEDVA